MNVRTKKIIIIISAVVIFTAVFVAKQIFGVFDYRPYYFANSCAYIFNSGNESYVALIVQKDALKFKPGSLDASLLPAPSNYTDVSTYLNVISVDNGKSLFKINLPDDSYYDYIQNVNDKNIVLKYSTIKHSGIFNGNTSDDTYDITTMTIDRLSGEVISKSTKNSKLIDYALESKNDILNNGMTQPFIINKKDNSKITISNKSFTFNTNLNNINAVYAVTTNGFLILGNNNDNKAFNKKNNEDNNFINSNFESANSNHELIYIDNTSCKIKTINFK